MKETKLTNKEKRKLAIGMRDYVVDIYRYSLKEVALSRDMLEIRTILNAYGASCGLCKFFFDKGLSDLYHLSILHFGDAFIYDTPLQLLKRQVEFGDRKTLVCNALKFRIEYMENFISDWANWQPWYVHFFMGMLKTKWPF